MLVMYLDDELNLHEESMGFYQVDGTSGRGVASTIKDALLMYEIPFDRLRGMSFDVSANMSGCYKCAQAFLRREKPHAVFVHCGTL